MKIAIVQMNPCVGDLDANSKKILEFCRQAARKSADLVITPELSLLGYPPKDLLLRDDFLHAQTRFLNQISAEVEIPVIVGAAIPRDERHLPYNAAVLCQKTGPVVVGQKILLPNYNVFDEERYFSTPVENVCQILSINGRKLLISICEDAWNSVVIDGEQKYNVDPIKEAMIAHGPVDVIINMSASPFTVSKPKIREKIFTNLAKTYQAPVLYVGQVGANDQWLFDGHSMIINSDGMIIERAQLCDEDLLIFDTDEQSHSVDEAFKQPPLSQVLVMGMRDYVEKCRLPGVVIGLSGGIDSAVCAVLAVRALGKKRVKLVYLPSRYSSPQSYADAFALAGNLDITLDCLLIESTIQSLRDLLVDALLDGKNSDIADQNLQSRLRGVVLMALANVSDFIMVATSNKSELAVGYSTIYGDMCGAFSAIGDLYKTEVYALAQEINKTGVVIPQAIIDRPPTAELKPDQLDIQSLPPYPVLDEILFNFIELEKSAADIEALTEQPRELIDAVIAMVHRSEYKRRQGPFPLMVSDKVFGDARRLPIAKRLF